MAKVIMQFIIVYNQQVLYKNVRYRFDTVLV